MTTTHFLVFLSEVDWHQYCPLSCQLLKYIIQRCSHAVHDPAQTVYDVQNLFIVIHKIFVLWCSNNSIFWWLTPRIVVLEQLYILVINTCIVVLEQLYSETPQIWVKISGAPKYKFRLNLGLMECKCSSECSARRCQATSCLFLKDQEVLVCCFWSTVISLALIHSHLTSGKKKFKTFRGAQFHLYVVWINTYVYHYL